MAEPKRRSNSGGLKRSPLGVNANGRHYVEILDGMLYVDHSQVKEFKTALKELCERFDYKFVPYDAWYEEPICPTCGFSVRKDSS
jgi:hypothetical protein